uniref:Uncharacterized protein n=1 Tax=Hemiselmis andersenii TaxID=464988 RepID=A0A6U4YMJ1_HEMAN
MELLHLTACLGLARTEGDKPELVVLKAKRGFVTVTAAPDASSQPSICASGRNVNTEAIVRALLSGRMAGAQATPLRTEKDLTAEERSNIKAQSVSEPLPDGFFFNGSNFVDFDGTVFQYHPEMDRLVAEYLEQSNQSLRAANQEAARKALEMDKELSGCIALAKQGRVGR